MSNTYGTIITTKGAAIIADCIVNGGQLVISCLLYTSDAADE